MNGKERNCDGQGLVWQMIWLHLVVGNSKGLGSALRLSYMPVRIKANRDRQTWWLWEANLAHYQWVWAIGKSMTSTCAHNFEQRSEIDRLLVSCSLCTQFCIDGSTEPLRYGSERSTALWRASIGRFDTHAGRKLCFWWALVSSVACSHFFWQWWHHRTCRRSMARFDQKFFDKREHL